MTLDEKIDLELKKNPELQKVFEEDPKKRELYKKKIMDSENAQFGVVRPNPKYCETCIFANGDPPFEDLPEKAYCMIYTRENGVAKPKSVYFDGAVCEYYNDGKEDTD